MLNAGIYLRFVWKDLNIVKFKSKSKVGGVILSSDKIENVLVLQGGGSLGAFGCGVFKALTNKNIRFDIVVERQLVV